MSKLFRYNKKNVSQILFVFFSLNFFPPILSAVENTQAESLLAENNDPYLRAAKFYLPSLTKTEQLETELAAKFKKENDDIAKGTDIRAFRNIGKISDLGQVETMRLIYQAFSNAEKNNKPKHVFIDDSVFAGLEMFCGKSEEAREKSWFSSIDRTITPFGKVALQSFFTKGFDSVEQQTKKAKKTQEMVKYLVENEKVFNELGDKLKDVLGKSSDLMFLFKPFDEKTQGTLDQFFFKSAFTQDFTRYCNENPLGYKLANNSVWCASIGGIVLLALLYASVVLKLREGVAFSEQMKCAPYIPMGISGLWLAWGIASGLYGGVINKKNMVLALIFSLSSLLTPCGAVGSGMAKDYIKRKWQQVPTISYDNKVSIGLYVAGFLACGAIIAGAVYLSYKRNAPVTAALDQAKLFVQKKSANIASLTNTISEIGRFCQDDKFLNGHFKLLEDTLPADKVEEQALFGDLIDLYNSVKDEKLPVDDSLFSMKLSRILTAFKKTHRLVGGFTKTLKKIGKLDAYWSLAKLYKEHADSINAKYCFVEFVESDRPYINIKDGWFPMLNPRWVVTNDVELGAIVKKRTLRVDAGSPVQPGCAIVTGPNAAGKTINLKSIISAVILATRTGIAPASSMKFTPFARMDTHMEVADKVGSMSRFESEKNSAIQFLQNLQQLHPNEFQLELMDEIFSSTNPEEGQSLAYAIASSLVDSPNCMCFIATHFKKLTELEAATNGYYKNYKVFVTVKPDGTFNRPYRLESGISDQNIAILMCKDEFSSKITDKAYQVLSQIKADTSDIVGYKKTPVAN